MKGEGAESFIIFKKFVGKVVSINDYARRNIRLIQDFVFNQKSEEMRQNLLLVVAKVSRKKLKKEMPKEQLSNV